MNTSEHITTGPLNKTLVQPVTGLPFGVGIWVTCALKKFVYSTFSVLTLRCTMVGIFPSLTFKDHPYFVLLLSLIVIEVNPCFITCHNLFQAPFNRTLCTSVGDVIQPQESLIFFAPVWKCVVPIWHKASSFLDAPSRWSERLLMRCSPK